jgi:hypothetical protein
MNITKKMVSILKRAETIFFQLLSIEFVKILFSVRRHFVKLGDFIATVIGTTGTVVSYPFICAGTYITYLAITDQGVRLASKTFNIVGLKS